MRAKMPIDPTVPNPQDPKDPPHSHDRGGGGYVSAWELLSETLMRVMAAGRSKEEAQADICRAIADRAIKICAELGRRTITRNTALNTVLDGNDFQIPTAIDPADLDWEMSRPLKPWLVRRGAFEPSGFWELAWIKLSRSDVTNVLCAAKEPQHAASSERPATINSRPALASQEMPVGSGSRSTAGPRKPGAVGSERPRGPRPQKFEQARDAMRNDIQQKRCTAAQLENMLEKDLSATYGVSRDTARKARDAVLLEWKSRQIPTNDK